MIEFMDDIAEAVKEFTTETVQEVAAWILITAVKGVILLTTPAWILPYMFLRDIMRDRNGGSCENPECDNCPFPPCEKGEARND